VIHIVAPINDFESKHSLSSALCGKAFPLSKRSPTLVGANKVFNGSILLGTLERANMDANGGTMCTGTLLNKVGTSSYFGAGGVRESVLAYPTLTNVLNFDLSARPPAVTGDGSPLVVVEFTDVSNCLLCPDLSIYNSPADLTMAKGLQVLSEHIALWVWASQ